MFQGFPLIPEQASTYAAAVDRLYYGLVLFSVFFSVLIFLTILYLSVRYRRRTVGEIPRRSGIDVRLEVLWTIAPFGISVGLLVWGVTLFMGLQRPPSGTLDIRVVGKQWMWQAQHPTGQREINELHVPLGQPVRLIMASEDVIHSFFVPAFRIKQDVLPGRYTQLWFEASKAGRYHLFCAEYCGTNHSRMGGWVTVMTPVDYGQWLAESRPLETPEAAGARLFAQLECGGCHLAGPDQLGPSLRGLYGQTVSLEGGRTVMADEPYLRESILDPAATVVAGYSPVMPAFRGQVTEVQVLDLIAYIKSVGPPDTGRPAP